MYGRRTARARPRRASIRMALPTDGRARPLALEDNVRTWIAGAGLFLWLGHAAWAQTAADKAAADTLFSEGKRLILAGETETACAKFEASLARLPQLGAQLALASCY